MGYPMKIDENKFIREATQCLYSSLQIEKALFETFKYLKKYFPLDLAHMFIYDTSKDTMRYLSLATEKGGVLIDERMHLSKRASQEIKKFSMGNVTSFVKSESFLIKEVFSHFKLNTSDAFFSDKEDLSVIATVFDLGLPQAGGFGLVTKGSNIYTKDNVKTLKLISGALTGAILNLLHHRDMVCLNERLNTEKTELQKRLGHIQASEIIGAESGLKEVMNLVEDVAKTHTPVLITGETGVGKEVIANAIHQSSSRSDGPFICINCGTIPETLADSELFGHEKGAFTGASKRKRGFFEQANGGTIFLDEVGELPLKTQVKFLRVLQSKEFQRIGGARKVSVDIRVITATNRNLIEMVKQNRFREDLWFRLNVFPIPIPPLRERRDDIPKLAEYFLVRKVREMNLDTIPQVPKESINQLVTYDWPGNIRELQNVIERALIVCKGEPLHFTELNTSHKVVRIRKDTDPFVSMDDMIVSHIKKALSHCNGKLDGKNGAAQMLKMNPSTLRGKMRKHGITKRVEY
jgi:transcriptional regulator with GAF, ATPase, and Fis domain